MPLTPLDEMLQQWGCNAGKQTLNYSDGKTLSIAVVKPPLPEEEFLRQPSAIYAATEAGLITLHEEWNFAALGDVVKPTELWRVGQPWVLLRGSGKGGMA